MEPSTKEDLEEPLLEAEACEDEEPTTGGEEDSETSAIGASRYYRAALTLLFVSFLFATLNVGMRSIYQMPDPLSPAQVNSARGVLTVSFFLPFLVGRCAAQKPRIPNAEEDHPHRRPLWMAAAELAVWNALGQVFANVGLRTTPSARASFLGQTVVVFVPLLSALGLGGGATWNRRSALGCCLSLLGVVLMSTSSDVVVVASSVPLRWGDGLILASAVCFSVYLIRISHLAHSSYDEVFLQGTKNAIMACLYGIWWMVEGHSLSSWTWPAVLVLAYTALGPGALADVLQQRAQRRVGATESNLILCTSSVFTAALARGLLGEETSPLEKLGGACLIAGAAVAGTAG